MNRNQEPGHLSLCPWDPSQGVAQSTFFLVEGQKLVMGVNDSAGVSQLASAAALPCTVLPRPSPAPGESRNQTQLILNGTNPSKHGLSSTHQAELNNHHLCLTPPSLPFIS